MEARAPTPEPVDLDELPRAPLPKRRPLPRARSLTDAVAIDAARRAAGIRYSPAYAAWLDRMSARS